MVVAPKTEIKTPVIAPTKPRIEIKAGVSNYKYLCDKYFGSESSNCLVIMSHESGGNPNAVSRTDDHGLLQLNCSFNGSKGSDGWCSWFGVTREQLKDPETNVRLAKEVWKRSGWGAWTTSKYLN